MASKSNSIIDAANEYFDSLVKSRFIEMFGDIKINSLNWPVYKMGDIFNLQMGKTPSRDDPSYWNRGNNGWVSISDLSSVDMYIDGNTREKITDIAVKESGIKLVPEDTVLMSFKLSIGKTAITTKPMYTNEAIMALVPNSSLISSVFLSFLIRYWDWTEGANKAVKGVTLNKSTMKSIAIPIPPIELQNQFADFVKQVDKSKLDFQKLVSIFDELVKSRFIEMFSDVKNKKRMSALGICKNGLNFKKTTNGFKIKCIGVGDFQDNLSTDQINQIEEIQIDRNISGPFLKDGDIVFVRSNGNKELVGRSILVKNIPEKTSFSGFCIAFNLQSTLIIPEFLIHYLHLDSTRQSMFGNSRGSNISNLTQGMILDVEVPIPEIEMQKRFIEFVQQVDKSKLEILEGVKRLYSS